MTDQIIKTRNKPRRNMASDGLLSSPNTVRVLAQLARRCDAATAPHQRLHRDRADVRRGKADRRSTHSRGRRMIDPKVFKQVRKALGLSQQELADALGLSRVTVNKMERGRLRRGIPDNVAEMLMAIKAHPKGLRTVERKPVEKLYRPLPDGSFIRDVWPTNDAHLWDNEEDDQ